MERAEKSPPIPERTAMIRQAGGKEDMRRKIEALGLELSTRTIRKWECGIDVPKSYEAIAKVLGKTVQEVGGAAPSHNELNMLEAILATVARLDAHVTRLTAQLDAREKPQRGEEPSDGPDPERPS